MYAQNVLLILFLNTINKILYCKYLQFFLLCKYNIMFLRFIHFVPQSFGSFIFTVVQYSIVGTFHDLWTLRLFLGFDLHEQCYMTSLVCVSWNMSVSRGKYYLEVNYWVVGHAHVHPDKSMTNWFLEFGPVYSATTQWKKRRDHDPAHSSISG